MSFTFIICKYKEIFESLRVRTHYLFNQNSLDETITAGGQKVESKEGTTTTGLCTPGSKLREGEFSMTSYDSYGPVPTNY